MESKQTALSEATSSSASSSSSDESQDSGISEARRFPSSDQTTQDEETSQQKVKFSREAAFKALLKKTQKSLTNSKCTKKDQPELPQSRIAAIQAPIPQVIQTKARLQQRRGAIIVLKKDIDKAKSELLCEAVLGMMSEQKEE